MSHWPFEDPPTTLVFTIMHILEKKENIIYVFRSADDGSWRVLPDRAVSVQESAIISLKEATEIDPTILDLTDLKKGQRAMKTIQGDWEITG